MKILITRYPNSPTLWTVVKKTEEGYIDNLGNVYQDIDNEPNYWRDFPEFKVGDIIKYSGKYAPVITIINAGIILENGITINNMDIVNHNIKPCDDEEVNHYFKELLTAKNIIVGSTVVCKSGQVFKVEKIENIHGKPGLIGEGIRQYAENCNVLPILTLEDTPFWTECKRIYPKGFWLHTLNNLAKELNSYVDDTGVNYCIVKDNNSYQITSVAVNYGLPMFKSYKLAEYAIKLMNGQLSHIYA